MDIFCLLAGQRSKYCLSVAISAK